MKTISILTVAGLAAVATAAPMDARGFVDSATVRADVAAWDAPVAGTRAFAPDVYTNVTGLGSAAGLALGLTGLVDSTFDFTDEVVGQIAGGTVDGVSSEFFSTDVPNGAPLGTTGTLQIDIFAADGATDLFSDALFVGGLPTTRAGHFMGANAGGDSLVNDQPVVVTSAIWVGLDAAGGAVWNTDVTTLVPTDVDGNWTGDFGVAFNSFGAGLGVIQSSLVFEYTVVPAPASAALLGLGGLAAVRRRR